MAIERKDVFVLMNPCDDPIKVFASSNEADDERCECNDASECDEPFYVERYVHDKSLVDRDKRIEKALETIHRFGQIDGAHHKAWCIDQVVRALTGDEYERFVKDYCNDGEWCWEVGIAP